MDAEPNDILGTIRLTITESSNHDITRSTTAVKKERTTYMRDTTKQRTDAQANHNEETFCIHDESSHYFTTSQTKIYTKTVPFNTTTTDKEHEHNTTQQRQAQQ